MLWCGNIVILRTIFLTWQILNYSNLIIIPYHMNTHSLLLVLNIPSLIYAEIFILCLGIWSITSVVSNIRCPSVSSYFSSGGAYAFRTTVLPDPFFFFQFFSLYILVLLLRSILKLLNFHFKHNKDLFEL
jgi:hypothetical protein